MPWSARRRSAGSGHRRTQPSVRQRRPTIALICRVARGTRSGIPNRAIPATVGTVRSWAHFAAQDLSLARAVRSAFAVREYATISTLRRDGSPRMDGTEVDFAGDGEIYLGIIPEKMRALDLRQDSRVAVLCPTGGPPANGPAGWLCYGTIDATAVEIEPDRFRLDIDSVRLTAVAPGREELTIATWHADRETTVTHRR